LLKVKKLELHGFKSFCDRDQLHFAGSGIASVVGPNGCGKSNVSDAISWVLGEQSAKSLRGSGMQDVIFSGSRDRKPSGLAQVSMTLLDPEVVVGTNGHSRPSEINVTRKLFRSGESQYLMNGKHCRLRDIQELFMGTGLGPNHYAIIEQGRIGQLLMSRPLDRRGFIEEAAGVTKFKTKKRLAELKLEHARQNLNRVNDILQEVIRQVNSLKRQASKARRYSEYREQLVDAAGVVTANRYRRLHAKAQVVGEKLDQAAHDHERRLGEAQKMETALNEKREQERIWESELEKGRQELSRLTVELERLRSRIEQQEQQAEDRQRRAEQANVETQAIDRRVEQLEKERAAERKSLEEVASNSEQVQARVKEKAAALGKLHEDIRQVEGRQEDSRKRVLSLLGQVSELRNQLAKIDEFVAGVERQTVRAREEEDAARKELEQIVSRKLELDGEAECKQVGIEEASARAGELEDELDSLRKESLARREQLDALQSDRSRLRARRESLDEILSHHAYTTETVKNLFAEIEQSPREDFAPIGILADFLEVDSKYERATEELLRDELEFIVVMRWDEARRGIELLRSDLQGQATFLVHPEKAVPGEPPALGPETGVTGRLADAIRFTNGLAESASTLLPKLRGCYLVEEEETAQRLAMRYPDLYFLLPDGVCHRGYTVTGGRKNSAGPLALKRELRELGPKLAAVERSYDENQAAAAKADQTIAERTVEREKLRIELQDLEKAALAIEHQIRQLNEQSSRAERRAATASREIERMGKETERAVAERRQHQGVIDQHERDRESAESGLNELRAQLEELQASVGSMSEEHTALRAEAAALEERRRAAASSLQRIERMLEEQKQRKELIFSQVAQWRGERERLLADNQRLSQSIEEFSSQREKNKTRVEETAANLDASRTASASLEEKLKADRIALEEARQARSALDLEAVQIRSDLKHLAEKCETELKRPVEVIAAEFEAELEDEQIAEAEQNYRELREKIERLGPVNVLALEEHQEAEQRQEFLETQQQDLLDSIRDTEEAIHEMDLASRKKFEEAFHAINDHFRNTFETLFGGGLGELRLTDPDNPGESGLEIVASPPGKRLQNVALLSGGEKSLTALALLMATFRYRPSPFCVLDEVDAALDEPNIRRFRRLLESMSGSTQFIIITHSKTTMAAAETLYGVTMSEPGVSKLVSVRMGDHRAAGSSEQPKAASPVGA